MMSARLGFEMMIFGLIRHQVSAVALVVTILMLHGHASPARADAGSIRPAPPPSSMPA
jgi:hypothetical protein